jgi:hypothetical protein
MSSSRKVLIRPISFAAFRVSHSQIVRTSHPNLRNALLLRRSRSRFLVNFASQNTTRLWEALKSSHLLCQCQKQPFTKMIFIRPGKTKSGVPGRLFRCRRKRYPIWWTSDRTRSSGRVSLPLTRAIMALRTSLENLSIKSLNLTVD